ncbi:VWA domain-containing protein [Methylobacterium sp. WSM2598]|uniref:VWA domain-containing protein n=1 Tax=Methylobacterium sp. WSM2598 TaxID=398261 RepID=UPI00036918D2|nr:VWA domain-containing protein [Methylobacterium sp. WSM2598]
MSAFAAFHFERPAWLLLLLPAAALWYLERRGSDETQRWRRVIDPELLRHLLVGRKSRSWFSPNALLLAVWVLAAFAVAGPAWEREPSPFADAKPPVMVVLRVAPTMMTPDLAPTRLDRARQKLADLLKLREGASTGLIAYSGSSHLVLPPTPDATVVLNLAQALSPEIMPREGDDIAGAAALADRVLAGGGHGGSILLVADTTAGAAGGLGPSRLGHPATVFALLPPDQDRGRLADVARSLDADLVATTVDQADVEAVARRLDRTGRAAEVAGEGQHWKEAGYWLTPLLALLTLLWFRSGWVTA